MTEHFAKYHKIRDPRDTYYEVAWMRGKKGAEIRL